MMDYDVVVIGGGIAGLYAAYRILEKDPNARLVVLERSDRLGGRAHSVMFHGVPIQEGAGIGRYRKDKKLRGLLEELGLPRYDFTSHHRTLFSGEGVSVGETVKALKQAATGFDRHETTFGKFARQVLGPRKYAAFLRSCGYSDFENADIIDTLEHYGFDDVGNIKAFGVPWNKLVGKLAEKVGAHRIQLRTEVSRIQRASAAGDYLVVAGDKVLRAKRVIMAGTIGMVQNLLPDFYALYRGIAAQPFARVYAKLRAPLARVESYTVVSGHLQKIIPIRPEEGIYMIAYSDNQHALAVRDKGKRYFERLLFEATGERARIVDLYHAFWHEGTHFFRPLPREFKNRREFVQKAQHPVEGIFVVGEAVSWRYQGWTEGALESVEAVLKKLES